ncbi:MAG: transglutaminase domain-containing protein [Bacteroidales bacterium]|nr:transglutaminase domain-containing protein [Bacteroidales bacterium]
MKRSEKILWVMVAIALAANIWLPRHIRHRYSWDRDLSQRLAVDFCRTRDEVKDYIRKYDPYVTDEQIDAWTKSGELESMVIGKRTMYFRNAAPNLFRLVPEMKAKKEMIDGQPSGGHEEIDAVTIPAIMEQVSSRLAAGQLSPGRVHSRSAAAEYGQGTTAPAAEQYLALPKRMRVRFSLTVPVNTLRPGKTLRCWLPFPRADVSRQTDIKFIEAGVDSVAYPMESITFSDPSCAHSSLYMEAKTNRYKDVTFYEVFEYTSYGEYHPIDPQLVMPYDTTSEEYKEYTSEREKHIIFTDRIKALADSLSAGIDNPYLQAKAFFTWIDENIPWASAREYSTMDNIPEYVLSERHGDCGMKTLLLLTLCRYKGIPARWESGLMTHPGAKNLHDWGKLYFEGYGWVPVDQSFGVTPYGGYFFLGGIEPYRLIINNDYGREFSPAKKYPRSDTVDFQKGEVEWEDGNLYFNQWDYEFTIEYL